MTRRQPTGKGVSDHPAGQFDPVVYVRYREPDDGEWEEACLQFQAGKSLLERVKQELEKHGPDCRRSGDCLFTHAERASILRALRRAGFDPGQVVDVDAPAVIAETDEGA